MILSPSLRTNGHIRLLPAIRTYCIAYFLFSAACVNDGGFQFEATVQMSTRVLFLFWLSAHFCLRQCGGEKNG